MANKTGYNKDSKTVFFRYPTEHGYKYAGFEHSTVKTVNAYISHQANAVVVALEAGNDERAFDILLDSIDELHRYGLFTIKSAASMMNAAVMGREQERRAMREDGTMDKLMYHTPISDYPAPRF